MNNEVEEQQKEMKNARIDDLLETHTISSDGENAAKCTNENTAQAIVKKSNKNYSDHCEYYISEDTRKKKSIEEEQRIERLEYEEVVRRSLFEAEKR